MTRSGSLLIGKRSTLLLALLGLAAGCRPVAGSASLSDARRIAMRDTAFLKLCAAPPDTSAASSGGCVLKDQGRDVGPRRIP
jgi:hypothetical protein